MSKLLKIVEKCPLCLGSGLVDGNRNVPPLEQWYLEPAMPETCPLCDGKGKTEIGLK